VRMETGHVICQPVAIYREFAPCDALREHVSAFFSCTAPSQNNSNGRLITHEAMVPEFCPVAFADGHVSIVVGWNRGSAGAHAETIGAMTAALPASVGPRLEMAGVYFRAGRASLFQHVPAGELTDRVLALQELWGAAGPELEETVGEADTDSARIDAMESVLLRRLGKARRPRTALDVPSLASHVLRQRGRLSVQWLADAAGVSRQRLTRVFRESVGVSPKMYCRLARFRAALARTAADVDWARLAVEMEYSDQSHMIAEFREFGGVTPGALASRRFFHPFLGRARPRPTKIS
jgi:prepilin-type processing-associated H-X9-DG protein